MQFSIRLVKYEKINRKNFEIIEKNHVCYQYNKQLMKTERFYD